MLKYFLLCQYKENYYEAICKIICMNGVNTVDPWQYQHIAQTRAWVCWQECSGNLFVNSYYFLQFLRGETTRTVSSTNLESNTVPSSNVPLKWKRTKSVLMTERLHSLGVMMTLVWTWSALLKMSSRTRSNTNVVSGGTLSPEMAQKEDKRDFYDI